MLWDAAFIPCLLKFVGVMPCLHSYLRRGWTLCSTGLICGLISRENVYCSLCWHAAPSPNWSNFYSCVFVYYMLIFSFHPSTFFWENETPDNLCRYCRDLLIETVPVTQLDFTVVLPRFLSLYVMSFLSPRDLCSAAQVSWHWRVLAEQVRSSYKKSCLNWSGVYKKNKTLSSSLSSGLYLGRPMH